MVFCGAGISLHSGIPLVSQLVPYVLDKLGIPRGTIFDNHGSLKIPFEAFMQVLVEGSRADRLLDIFGSEDAAQDELNPNLNHLLLARLAQTGRLKTIVTTNFDRLIEKALEIHGLLREQDYLVFQDESDFSRIDWSDPRLRLVKIHGSVENRSGMAVTFKRVESQGLSQPSLEVIHHIYSQGDHNDVLVLGYSSSDKFDLTPQIRLSSYQSKNVFYVEHSSKSKVEPINQKGPGDPFMLFEKGVRIFYNTDELMKTLWAAFYPLTEYRFERHETRWRECVDDWYAMLPTPSNHLLVGNLFKKAANFSGAAGQYEMVLIHARKVMDRLLLSDALGLLGEARQGLGELSLARNLYEESLVIAEELHDETRIARAKSLLRNLTPAAVDRRAEQELEEALKEARQVQDRWEEGNLLINLGNSQMSRGHYEQALSCYEQALTALWGDTQAACILYNNMGMAYVKSGQIETGQFLYRISIEMCQQLGDRQGEGLTRFVLGESLADQGDYEAALKEYEETLRIAEAIGDSQMKAQALAGIARCPAAAGRSAEAAQAILKAVDDQNLPVNPEIHRLNEEAKMSFVAGKFDLGAKQLEQAHDKAIALGDLRGQIETLNNMGIAAVGMNQIASGIESHETALELARQIGDRSLEVYTLERIVRLYAHIGRPHEALRYYEASIQRARASGDRAKEIDYLNLLAKMRYNLEDYPQAIAALERALQLARETEDVRLQGVILNNLGNIHASLDQFEPAASCYQRAIRLFHSLHLADSVAATQSALDQLERRRR